MNKKLRENIRIESLIKTPETEIFVEIQNDSIWRHTKQNGVTIGDYFMFQNDSGINPGIFLKAYFSYIINFQ